MWRRWTPWPWRPLVVEVVNSVRRWWSPPVTRSVHVGTSVLRRIRALALELLMLMLTWWWGEVVVSRRAMMMVHVSVIGGRSSSRWITAWHRMVITVATLIEFVRGFILLKSRRV